MSRTDSVDLWLRFHKEGSLEVWSFGGTGINEAKVSAIGTWEYGNHTSYIRQKVP